MTTLSGGQVRRLDMAVALAGDPDLLFLDEPTTGFTAVIPNADASPAIVNAVALPLEFLSGIFIPFGNGTPSWILWVARARDNARWPHTG